ncbi:MAG: SRPBCC domain-containing protein [Gemmatimonadota bacterium]|jgi:uncharacterized protein YndB with AHSA1/START domain
MSEWRAALRGRGLTAALAAALCPVVEVPPLAGQRGMPTDPARECRDLEFRILVPTSPARVIEDWLDPSTVDRFLGVSSSIEARRGGRYEIRFMRGDDADARANSTAGARILALERGRHLAFEWRVPPWAREPARSAPATRVDLWAVPGDSHPAAGGRTILHLRHSGFGTGEAWDEVRSFFQWNWFRILSRYEALPG